MTSSELRSSVRRKCGKVVNTAELADTDIDEEGSWILRKIADRVTVKVLRNVTSVANQREYDVHANTVRVSNVYSWTEIESDLLDIENKNIIVDEAESSEYYNFPSVWMITMMRKKRGLPRFKWHFNPIIRKLQIDPYPEVAGEDYYYESVEKINWTLANVPTDFEETVVLGTTWRCLQQIMLVRTRLGGVQRSGGMVDYPAERLKSLVDQYRDDFYEDLRIKSTFYNI